jgi:transposase
MVQIHSLSEEEILDLTDGYKNGHKHYFRIRCQSILLSNADFSVSQIAERLSKQKDTIYSWLERFEENGISGLKNIKGQGVKAALDSINKEQKLFLIATVEDGPQSLKEVCHTLTEKLGFPVTKWKLIRYLKKNSISLGAGLEKL